MADAAFVEIDLSDGEFDSADRDLFGFRFADRAKRAGIRAFLTAVTNVFGQKGSGLQFRIGQNHMEALTGTELLGKYQTVIGNGAKSAGDGCIVKIGIYVGSGAILRYGNAAGLDLAGIGENRRGFPSALLKCAWA